MKIRIIRIIGGIATIAGVILIARGDITNGLLSMILGEVMDIPKYDTFHENNPLN